MTMFDPRRPGAVIDAVKKHTHNQSDEAFQETLDREIHKDADRIEAEIKSIGGNEVFDQGGRFDVLSLSGWLEAARRAGVPRIEAHRVGRMNVMDMIDKPEMPELDVAPDAGGMVRPDFSAGAQVKVDQAMRGPHTIREDVAGTHPKDDKICLHLDDRLLGQVMSYAAAWESGEIPIYWRPWYPAAEAPLRKTGFLGRMMGREAAGSWPLEWRVFVDGGEVAGVSAYYTQGPVEAQDWVIESARQAVSQAQAILETLQGGEVQPWHPRYQWRVDDDARAFTLDFLVQPDGEPVLLEGGPACLNAYRPDWGAHPCFFQGRDIAGLALSMNDIRPLPAPDISQKHGVTPTT